MRVWEFFLHLITPRQSNNHKARAIHSSSILAYLVVMILFQFGLMFVGKVSPSILGYASNISVSDLLTLTNQKRAENGQSAVSLNSQLSAAAAGKAADMFANQYWAHISPSGRDPWSFITGAGYNFLFAGENLARDFGDSLGVVDAWMNSPSHRENMVNSHYVDVGFAIANGKYGDHETTLVVQMFGAPAGGVPAVSSANSAPPKETAPPLPEKVVPIPIAPSSETPTAPAVLTQPSTPAGLTITPTPTVTPPPNNSFPSLALALESSALTPKIDLFTATRNFSLAITVFLLAIYFIDSVILHRRQIIRLSGHNFAHMMLLGAVLFGLALISRGVVL